MFKIILLNNFVCVYYTILCQSLQVLIFYSSFAVLIFNSLNISTTTIGVNTSIIISTILAVGNIGILNIFLKEGINNISNLVNTKLKDTSARAEKLIELGENYKSVDSNKNLSGDSETKFVLVVEGQKAKDTTKSNTTKTTKVSLWQRIKNLFK